MVKNFVVFLFLLFSLEDAHSPPPDLFGCYRMSKKFDGRGGDCLVGLDSQSPLTRRNAVCSQECQTERKDSAAIKWIIKYWIIWTIIWLLFPSRRTNSWEITLKTYVVASRKDWHRRWKESERMTTVTTPSYSTLRATVWNAITAVVWSHERGSLFPCNLLLFDGTSMTNSPR